MQAMSAPYPATFTFDPPEKVANWRPLVNWILAIPHFIVLYALNIVSEVVAFLSWFVILFTGKLRPGFRQPPGALPPILDAHGYLRGVHARGVPALHVRHDTDGSG